MVESFDFIDSITETNFQIDRWLNGKEGIKLASEMNSTEEREKSEHSVFRLLIMSENVVDRRTTNFAKR